MKTLNAPVHERYVKQAKESKQALKIVLGNKEMVIPYKDLKPVRWTGGHRDKWDGTHYSIAYFNWSPSLKGKAKKVSTAWDKYNAMSQEQQQRFRG